MIPLLFSLTLLSTLLPFATSNCPSLPPLRSDAALSLDIALLSGKFYEQKFTDLAQVGESCQRVTGVSSSSSAEIFPDADSSCAPIRWPSHFRPNTRRTAINRAVVAVTTWPRAGRSRTRSSPMDLSHSSSTSSTGSCLSRAPAASLSFSLFSRKRDALKLSRRRRQLQAAADLLADQRERPAARILEREREREKYFWRRVESARESNVSDDAKSN